DGGPVDLTASGLTSDQEFQAGSFCGSAHATPTTPLPSPCPAGQFGSTLVSIPAPGTENDDKNPPRIAPRHLFDIAVGDDNLFHGEKYKWSLRLTAVNIPTKLPSTTFCQPSLEPTTLRPAVIRRSWASTSNSIVPEGLRVQTCFGALMVHGDKYKWSLRFITVNLTNKVALYNFLSTFGGTHYVHRGATQPNWD